MALTTEALDQIRSLLEMEGSSAADRMSALRSAFPGLSVTRCDAGDMDTETPVLETQGYNVYLIDTREHCVKITVQPEAATGVILAEKRRVTGT